MVEWGMIYQSSQKTNPKKEEKYKADARVARSWDLLTANLTATRPFNWHPISLGFSTPGNEKLRLLRPKRRIFTNSRD